MPTILRERERSRDFYSLYQLCVIVKNVTLYYADCVTKMFRLTVEEIVEERFSVEFGAH